MFERMILTVKSDHFYTENSNFNFGHKFVSRKVMLESVAWLRIAWTSILFLFSDLIPNSLNKPIESFLKKNKCVRSNNYRNHKQN